MGQADTLRKSLLIVSTLFFSPQFQKAARTDAVPATLSLQLNDMTNVFPASPDAVKVVHQQAMSIADIMRGAYLYAKSKVALDQLGTFGVGLEAPSRRGYAVWEVRPALDQHAVVSRSLWPPQHSGVLAVDLWETA